MKQEFITLKTLVTNEISYYQKLIEFYSSKKISIEEIVNYKENGLQLNGDALNKLIVNQCKDLSTDIHEQLYLIAVELGSTWAMRNYAVSLIQKDNVSKEFLLKALKLLDEATQKNVKIGNTEYYFGVAHFKLQHYAAAYRYFRKVPEKDDGKDNPLFLKAAGYLKSYPEMPKELLKLLYAMAGKEIDPAIANLTLQEGSDRIPPWHNVSQDFDGFDPYDDADIILAWRQAKIAYEMVSRGLEILVQQLEEATSDKNPRSVIDGLQARKIELEKEVNEKRVQLGKATKAYESLLNKSKDKEYRRQVQTEKHFFSSQRTHSTTTFDIAKRIQYSRFDEKAVAESMDGSNIPVRRLITAELSTIKASLHAYGRAPDYQQTFGWHVALTKKGQGYYSPYDQNYGNLETVHLGASKIQYRQRTNVHSNHVGDFYLEDLGSYANIFSQLIWISGSTHAIANQKNEMLIATWMLRYSRAGTVVSLEELQAICTEAKQENLDQLMRIFFHCLVKEPSSWMMSANESNELPFATAQARAIKLIAGGFLTLKDVFNENAPYGIFTGKNIGANIENVREKIDRINAAYNQCILNPKPENLQLCFLFQQKCSKRSLVTTRARLHKDLIDTYGGNEDSDGEGYNSDSAEKLYKGPFEFK